MQRIVSVLESPRLILLAGQYHMDRLLDHWPFKLLLSPFMVFYGSILGGNGKLLLFFYVSLLLDLLLGAVAAGLAGKFSPARFGGWVVKAVTYTLCIFLVGMVSQAVAEIIGVNWLLDAFMGVMVITEVLSVLRNMAELGWPVPPIAVRLAAKAQSQAGHKLDELLGAKPPDPPVAPQPESGEGEEGLRAKPSSEKKEGENDADAD